MLSINSQLWRKLIASVSLIAIAIFGWQYWKQYPALQATQKIKSLIQEQKTLEAVLVSLETIGESLDRNGEVTEPIQTSLANLVPILRERQRFSSDTTAYIFSPDRKYLVTGHQNGLIRFWQPDGTPTQRNIETGKNEITEIAIDSESKKLLVGSGDGELQIWNLDKLTLTDSWSLGMLPTKLAISPDDEIIVAAGGKAGGELGIWDIEGEVIRSPQQTHWIQVSNIVFTPDGQKFLTSDVWGRILQWNRQGETLNQLEAEELGHDSRNIAAIVFPHEGEGKYYLKINNFGLNRAFLAEDLRPSSRRIGGIGDLNELYIPDFSQSNSDSELFILDRVQIWDADLSSSDGYFAVSYQEGFIQAYDPYAHPFGNLVLVDGGVYDLEFSSSGVIVAGKVLGDEAIQIRLWETFPIGKAKAVRIIGHRQQRYKDWENLLNHTCYILKSHSALNNPSTETVKNAAKTCQNYAEIE